MEILNFEMRNYFAETNTNYKAFATGGDKAQSCWMANFVPFDKVTDIYLFESAIDAMSFYEINHYTKETTCAFISTGGYVTKSQIENISRIFPSELNSTCKCNRILINNLFKFFVWREVSKSFTRSIIEFIFNPLNLFVGYFTKVLTLWDILPDKPVGVFIGTTFP